MPSVACGTRRGAAACGLPGKPPCTVAPCPMAGMFCLHLLHGNAVRAVLRADTCRFALPNGPYRHPAEAVSRGCFCSSANGWLPGCWLAAYSVRNMFTHSAPPLPCRGACCLTAATAIKPLAAGLPGPGIRPCAWLLLRRCVAQCFDDKATAQVTAAINVHGSGMSKFWDNDGNI